MATKDDDKDKEPQVTPVGPGAEEEEVHEESDERETSAKASSEDDDEDDERVGRSEEDDGEDEDDPQRARLKSKRRHERKRRRERDRNDRVELNFLRSRNEQLERRFSEVDVRLEQADIGNIDSRIGQLDQQIAEAERVYAEAINKQNGATAAEAMSIRDQLRDAKSQLNHQKGQRVQSVRQHQQQGQQQQIDPVVARNVESWISENDWFDPQLKDEDSRIARAIEDSLYSEGRLNARTPEYWEEYNRRLAKRGIGSKARRNGHGDRYDEDDSDEEDDDEPDERPAKRQAKGPRITTGGRERPLKKGEVYISAERRDAMEKAGAWENPTLRAKYLRQYAKYDAEHRGDRSRR